MPVGRGAARIRARLEARDGGLAEEDRPEEISGAARLWVVVDSNTDGYNCKKLRLFFCTRGLGEPIRGVVEFYRISSTVMS